MIKVNGNGEMLAISFSKGDNLCKFLFTSLDDKTLPKWKSTQINLLLNEQILFKVGPN